MFWLGEEESRKHRGCDDATTPRETQPFGSGFQSDNAFSGTEAAQLSHHHTRDVGVMDERMKRAFNQE
jgi:hypothetical protein